MGKPQTAVIRVITVLKHAVGSVQKEGINTCLIDPGKPWQNGCTESFNGRFRDECLSMEWFKTRAQARVLIESWRQHDNEVRPHSRPGYLTPQTFRARHDERHLTAISQ